MTFQNMSKLLKELTFFSQSCKIFSEAFKVSDLQKLK
jgi:hypothetical protein